MEENFTLTAEILGAIIKDAYWNRCYDGKGEADKDWKRVAGYVLEKLRQIVEHKKHHNCIDTNGDTPDHYMYFGCLLQKFDPKIESWTVYGVVNHWLCTVSSEKEARERVEMIHSPARRTPIKNESET